ncbi:MAG: serine/threonine-protein kinase [Chloroflexota bacterium]|nr:serine/threonine-protein kinase [Chloroflexota bacterium]
MTLTPGQVIHDRYRVIALLSQGGMGAVYEAMDLNLNVRCALKEMMPYPGTPGTVLPQLREQFQQEAQLLADLRYPNLPRVTDHFEEDGNAYLTMDFVYGKRLDEIINQEGMLAEDEVLEWSRQLIGALAYCHEQGVIHRDVKPQNVVITPQGQAMLVDFGLAKLVDPDEPRTRTVMRGIGTPEYAPPEQYDAKKGYTDARTDIYSLAATMYHALTGESPPTVTEQVVNPNILKPPSQHRDDLSKVTEQVLIKAMALQPDQRFQSIAEMHEALFGSPLPKAKAESIVFPSDSTDMLVKPPSATVLLPWIDTAKRRFDWRIGTAAAIVIASLATVIWVVGGTSAGNISTSTATSTVTVTPTSTHTPTVMPSSTITPTASPTLRPTMRRPTETPDAFIDDEPYSPTPASPTPTQVYIPSPTHTPTPIPTDTPRPAPARTHTPKPSLVPSDTPTPEPTSTLEPTFTLEPTVKPTLGSISTESPLNLEEKGK